MANEFKDIKDKNIEVCNLTEDLKYRFVCVRERDKMGRIVRQASELFS